MAVLSTASLLAFSAIIRMNYRGTFFKSDREFDSEFLFQSSGLHSAPELRYSSDESVAIILVRPTIGFLKDAPQHGPGRLLARSVFKATFEQDL